MNVVAPSRHVLVVAYHFPPIASSGTFRTLKFVKYLADFGWQPIVLTIDPRHEETEPIDDNLLTDIPASVKVIRTYSWSLRKILPRSGSSRESSQSVSEQNSSKTKAGKSKGAQAAENETLQRRLARSLKSIIYFPDRFSGWYPFAVTQALCAMARHDIQIIYTSAPPYTGTLIGLTLKYLTGKPLVSDFRDPWVRTPPADHAAAAESTARSRADRLAAYLENKTFKYSSSVIHVSPELSDAAKRRASPSVNPARRFLAIPNGFDPQDFPPDRPRERNSNFHIVHTGCFYAGNREPTNFLLALNLLRQKHPEVAKDILASFIGDIEWPETNASWIGELGIKEQIEFLPFRPHHDALKLLANSDLLLLIGSTKKADTGRPAKLFEYLATRRPILALVQEGELAELVRSSGMGIIANPNEPEEIVAALLQAYREVNAGRFERQPNEDLLRLYDRRELTRQLAIEFDRVSSKSGN